MRLQPLLNAMLVCSIVFVFQSCNFNTVERPQGNIASFSIDHYAINVSDLERSVAFYQELFDLKEIKNGTGLDHIRWFGLGTNQELHIIQVDSLDKKIPKGVHLALRTFDLEGFRASVTSKNIPYSDWPGKESKVSMRPDGVRQIYLQDPDGYWIEVNDANKNSMPKPF